MFSTLHGAVCNGLWGNNSCGGYSISGAADQRDRMSGGSGGGGSYDSSGDRSLTNDRGSGSSNSFFSSGGMFNGGSGGIPWGAGIGN